MLGSWLSGVAFGAVFVAFIALGIAGMAVSTPQYIPLFCVFMFFVIFYMYGMVYVGAKNALATSIAGLTVSPLAPNPLPNNTTELAARSFTVGMTAVFNSVGCSVIASAATLGFAGPLIPILAAWVFIINSLAAFPAVSRNRIYQGLLGWSGWIMPLSLMASVFGFIWFAINAIPALISGIAGGGWPFRIDFSTGAIETVGGITGLISTSSAAAGTVGHFVFVLAPFGTNPSTLQPPFLVAVSPSFPGNVSAHEVGHTLDYVAFSGFRVIFALIDQVIMGNLFTAYSELTADSHVPNPGRIQVRVWS